MPRREGDRDVGDDDDDEVLTIASPPASPVVSSMGFSASFSNPDTPLLLPEGLDDADAAVAVEVGVGARRFSSARMRWARLSRSWSCCSSPELGPPPFSTEAFECAPSIVFVGRWVSVVEYNRCRCFLM